MCCEDRASKRAQRLLCSLARRSCTGKNCNNVLKSKKLKCPMGFPRGKDDWHSPFGNAWDQQSDSRLQQECCRTNCYSAMTAKSLTCAAGTHVRAKEDYHDPFGGRWGTRSEQELKRECCRQPNCYFAIRERGLTCAAPDVLGSPRGYNDGHNPFGSRTFGEQDNATLVGECCRRNCWSVLTGKNLTCRSGVMRGKDDWHSPFRGSSFDDWDRVDSQLLGGCCRKNCDMVMREQNLTCDSGRPRGKDDWHDPLGGQWDRPAKDITRACCQQSCHDVMGSRKLSCDAGTVRGKGDMHDPFGGQWHAKSDAQIQDGCCRRNCHMEMLGRNLSCSRGGIPRRSDDWHMPWGGMFASRADSEVMGECCEFKCPGVLQAQGASCDANSTLRQHHNPFKNRGSGVDASLAGVKATCCEQSCRTLQCPGGMEHNKGCEHRGENDKCVVSDCCSPPTCKSWVNMTSGAAMRCSYGTSRGDSHRCKGAKCTHSDCCSYNCHQAMAGLQLKCPAGAQPRSQHDWHTPWTQGHISWSDSGSEYVRECCQTNCYLQMGRLNQTCYVGERQDDGHTPAGASGLQWNIGAATMQKECCQQNCHAVMGARKLSCDVGEMRGKDDWHMPWGSDWSRPDADVKQQCCRQNCATVMGSRKLSCAVGQMRDKSDWHDPFGGDWARRDHIITKQCCRQSCHAVMATKNLSCSAGLLRPAEHWHDPWSGKSNIWDKADSQLKASCCVENCYTAMQKRSMKCGTDMVVRRKDDFHHPSFVSRSSPDWSKASTGDMQRECCRKPDEYELCTLRSGCEDPAAAAALFDANKWSASADYAKATMAKHPRVKAMASCACSKCGGLLFSSGSARWPGVDTRSISIEWRDCGAGKGMPVSISSMTPSAMTGGGAATTITGSGTVTGKAITGGTFELKMQGHGGEMLSCSGDAAVPKKCAVVAHGTTYGHGSFQGIAFPMATGKASGVPNISLALYANMPSYALNTKTTLTVSDKQGKPVMCAEIHTSQNRRADGDAAVHVCRAAGVELKDTCNAMSSSTSNGHKARYECCFASKCNKLFTRKVQRMFSREACRGECVNDTLWDTDASYVRGLVAQAQRKEKYVGLDSVIDCACSNCGADLAKQWRVAPQVCPLLDQPSQDPLKECQRRNCSTAVAWFSSARVQKAIDSPLFSNDSTFVVSTLNALRGGGHVRCFCDHCGAQLAASWKPATKVCQVYARAQPPRDCRGVVSGNTTEDRCGICGGKDTCLDCKGMPNGNARKDKCNNCDAVAANDCQIDCKGVWGGKAQLDRCNVCSGSNTCVDCRNVTNGKANTDRCNTCDTNAADDCQPDCKGAWGGTAKRDACGRCGGSNACVDCKGVVYGQAFEDRCGRCIANQRLMCRPDCKGVYGGTAQRDFCGKCGGDNSTCVDCKGCVLSLPSPTLTPLTTARHAGTGRASANSRACNLVVAAGLTHCCLCLRLQRCVRPQLQGQVRQLHC